MTARWRTVIPVAISVALAAGPVRAQIGPILVVEAATADDSTDFKQVVANCPPGTIAFGGGAAVSPAAQPNIIHQSLPQGDPPDRWLAVAQERLSHAAPWQLKSTALCATVEGYELVHQASPFDSTSTKEIAADCPPGKVPIGGGGGIFFFGPDLALQVLRPTATGWTAFAREQPSVATDWRLDVRVSCAPGLDVERYMASTLNSSESRDNLTLSCPSNRIAIGGGAATLVVFGALNATTPLVGSGAALDGWSAGARRDTPTSWSQEVDVLCDLPVLFRDGFESEDAGGWGPGEVP